MTNPKPYIQPDGEVRELDETFFKEAFFKNATVGQIPIPLDPDVVEHYRNMGEGWQTRINDDLRKNIR